MGRGNGIPADARAAGPETRPAVLIYDGECPVCRGAADWIRGNAAPAAFDFLSCHSEELPRRFPAVERAACLQAMHLVLPGGAVLVGAKAVPEILSRLRGRRYRWAAALFRIPGAGVLSGAFYRWFAGNRHHISRLLPSGRR